MAGVGVGVGVVTIAGEIACTGAGKVMPSEGAGEGLVSVAISGLRSGLRFLDTLVSRATSMATATTIPRKASRNRVRGCLAHFTEGASRVNDEIQGAAAVGVQFPRRTSSLRHASDDARWAAALCTWQTALAGQDDRRMPCHRQAPPLFQFPG